MDTLLHVGLSNAVVAAALALVVAVCGRVSRRPALVHSLWLLVLLKLISPPVWPVSLPWPVRSEPCPAATDLVGPALELPARHVCADAPGAMTKREMGDRRVEVSESADPAATLANAADPMPDIPPAPNTADFAPGPETLYPATTATPSPASWQSFVLAIWLAGSALWFALAAYRLYRFHRLLRFAQQAPAKLQNQAQRLAGRLALPRCPSVWVVPAPICPLLWAFGGTPRLLVPVSLLRRLSEAQWDTLLAHELAHLRRRDHWVRILELVVLGLYWWHPVVWWARRELREAEEQCCDAWVVWALPGAAEVYATTLVEAVTYLSGTRSALPLAASGIGQMQLLKRRLTMIMRGTTPRALSSAGFLAVLGLGAVLLPLWPTWAQTETLPEGTRDQQAGAKTGETGGDPFGPGGGTDVTFVAEGQGPAAVSTPYSNMPPGNQEYAVKLATEYWEDARDEVELLTVQLNAKRAEMVETQARLNQARRQLEKVEKLSSSRVIGSEELDRARTEVEIQEARLDGKKAQTQEAELRLKKAQRRLAKLSAQRPQDRDKDAPPREKEKMPANVGPGGGTMKGLGSGKTGASPGRDREMAPAGGLGLGGGLSGGFGGLGGGLSGGFGGLGGGGAGLGDVRLYEHRLAEVEKKLEELLREVKALRQDRQVEKDKPLKKP